MYIHLNRCNFFLGVLRSLCRPCHRRLQTVPLSLTQFFPQPFLGPLPIRAGASKLAAACRRQAPEAFTAVGAGLGSDPSPVAQRREGASQSCAVNDEAFPHAPLGCFSRARECHQQTELCDVYPAAPNLSAIELGDGAGGAAEVGAGAEKGGYFNFFALRCRSARHNNTCIYTYHVGLSSYFFT